MLVKDCISGDYQKADAYSGVESVEDILVENNFLIVFDGDQFCGILTPVDLIRHPHKLVIDCITEKDQVGIDDSIISALEKMYRNRSFALPVFDAGRFAGIIEKKFIIQRLTVKIEELYSKSLISEKVRTEFLNNLSHEIRTPLNGIIGFLDIISTIDLSKLETEGAEYVGYMRESSERFLVMMEDLVQLSRIHAGDSLEVYRKVVNMEAMFVELKELFFSRTVYSGKADCLRHINPDPSLSLMIDGQKLKHIFFHLIENAIKFSVKKEPVFFGLKEINKVGAVFFVSNKGSQIPEEDKAKMFGIFEKQKRSCHFIEGLGIGLPVVKSLLAALGGFIEVYTEDETTTFEFLVPVESTPVGSEKQIVAAE